MLAVAIYPNTWKIFLPRMIFGTRLWCHLLKQVCKHESLKEVSNYEQSTRDKDEAIAIEGKHRTGNLVSTGDAKSFLKEMTIEEPAWRRE